jgi:hypothetical protein
LNTAPLENRTLKHWNEYYWKYRTKGKAVLFDKTISLWLLLHTTNLYPTPIHLVYDLGVRCISEAFPR